MTSDTDSGSPSELNGTSIETPARAPTPVHQFGTRAVHAGAHVDATTGAVIAPISLSTTFAQVGVGKPIGQYEYTRSANPNRDHFEEAVAALEHARYALAFASGSATTAVILQSLAAGSHVISVSDPLESYPRPRRHQKNSQRCPSARHYGRCRQYLPQPLYPEPARLRCRHRRALCHKVYQWPL
ncbi:cystathionine-gamma-lyase [Histoplasma capsulatum]|uniref:cystathionine gamma-lyase n=1 Tax=Ajellomyces capsulatus TaxID=5037 RepID=A0A8A1MKK2_AJECA|nr:cystathionine-gamma-lyase [Histoplasma capsulatum]